MDLSPTNIEASFKYPDTATETHRLVRSLEHIHMGNVQHDDETKDSGRVRRRSVLKYGGAGAVTAGLAGCQSPDNPLPGGQLRVPSDDPPEPTPGEDEGDGALAGETIRIGVLAPMNLPLGESMWDAARMARDMLNANGGIMGATVEVELGNTKVSPGDAESEHRRLVVQEDCDMTTGIFLGSALLQTLPSIANQERLHFTTASAEPRAGQLVSSTDGSLTDSTGEEEYERFKYHFRVGPIHLLDLADAMLEFIENVKDDFGWEQAGLLTENLGEFTPYAERLQNRLSDIIDVPVTERPGGISDWSPLYNEMESEGVDIAIVGLALTGTTAVNQWTQQERNFEFGGIHVPSQAYEYWESTGGNTEYVFTMNAMTPQTENTDRTQDFVQNYIETWDEVPIYSGALEYEAFGIIDQSIRITVEEEGLEEVPDAETMIPYMEDHHYSAEPEDPVGGTILSEFQFTPPDAQYAHEPLWTSIEETGVPVFQQWQYDTDIREDYGTMHSVYPEQNKTAEYAIPEWIERGN